MDFTQLAKRIINAEDEALTKENANMNGDSFVGKSNKLGTEYAKWFAKESVMPQELVDAIDSNLVYVHDLDQYAVGATNCIFIPFDKVLEGGFQTSNGKVREPQSIMTAAALVAIVFQIQQNCQYGGVSANKIDWDLAPYVAKSFRKHFKKGQKIFQEGIQFSDESINMNNVYLEEKCPKSYSYAITETTDETFQAMESLVHNLNTMHSRPGGQVPFTSVNYGMCTSREGRMISESLLQTTIDGVGDGETPIFPQHIFQCKRGVNVESGDPNYDLFQKAIECSSKRMYPNFVNVDAPHNLELYDEKDPNTIIATMGCRTRVGKNRHGKASMNGRGNLSFNTINLVGIALESQKDESKFYKLLDEQTEISMQGLLHRFNLQSSQNKNSFDFMMKEGVWREGDEKEVSEALLHGTLGIGFIGLAEATKAMYGEHHGESDWAYYKAQQIVKHMHKACERYSDLYDKNVSLFATPAEGLSGKFTAKDKEKYGVVDGVTDREYYTNSFHIPVYHDMSMREKIVLEAPFHAWCTGGAISYIELDGNARNNPKAFEKIVKFALSKDVGYFSINHSLDGCPACGYEGIIGDECPVCHVKEGEVQFRRLRRVTGYLTGNYQERFNPAKQAEVRDRVKHR